MNMAFAPAQLTLAPRPLPAELLSSWLLRTAAAHAISLAQLRGGLPLRYPESLPPGGMLDYSVPPVTLRALSHFSRVPLTKLRQLDLSVRVPHLHPGLLRRFHGQEFSIDCPRVLFRRIRYAWCPQCLTEQKSLHIRWDWCFAALVRCAVHRTALLDGCPHCGGVDPLNFSLSGTLPAFQCRSCFTDLTWSSKETNYLPDDNIISVVETAYRSALLGIASHPKLLDNATDRAFRRFIEDMLQTLLVILSSRTECPGSLRPLLLPRRSLLMIIAELVRNATSTEDSIHRRAHYRRSLVLWSTLFQVMSDLQGKELERCSQFWPLSLRRRFATALEHRRRKRRPYDPYPAQTPCLKYKYNTLAAVFDLSATPEPQNSKSRI